MRRHELSDEDGRRVAPLLPKEARGGRRNDHRTTLSGRLWILGTGSPWRDFPERFGRWQSVYDRIQPLAQGRHLRPRGQGASHPPGTPGRDRLGPVVHRRHERARDMLGGERVERSARTSRETTR